MENQIYDAFDAAMARDWLNALISNMKQRASLEKLNSQIEATPTQEYIQTYSGIEILSDILEEELLEKERKDGYLQYYFFYQGVKILQLSKERLGKYAGAA